MADELFASDTFIVLTKDKTLKEKTEESISESGGAIARSITKRVTVVVVDNESDFSADIKKATGLSIPVVSFSFIDKSIANNAREKPENHKVDTSAGDAGPSAKKQKVDDTASGIHKDSEWMGVTIGSDASAYPFVLEITAMEDNGQKFSGTIKWPTLGKGAVTKVRGTVQGDEVKFEEYEAVSGADDVELPMYYTGKLTGDKLNGKLKDSTGEESTFNLSKIKSKSGITTAIKTKDLTQYVGLPKLAAKTTVQGVLTLSYNYTVRLTSLASDGKVEGSISWPSVAAETKFVGTVNDSDLVFEENKILKGDGIEIPVKYEGKIDSAAKSVTGSYEAPTSKGSFTLLEAAK
eukprot:Phypoly_transcript_01028.p2 GENE.Phypoly_transcript_01028~~Phypoly_transcript_01028.p2  ORF type:complete len:365 (-),score=58.56 Phypoly_transcript_01028:2678-3727(-)